MSREYPHQSRGTGRLPRKRALTRRQRCKAWERKLRKKTFQRNSNTVGAIHNRSINEQRRYEHQAKSRRSK